MRRQTWNSRRRFPRRRRNDLSRRDRGYESSTRFFLLFLFFPPLFFRLTANAIDDERDQRIGGWFAGRFAVGQNIARTWTTRPPGPYDGESDWRRQISGWFNEVQYYHTGYSKATGHYTQVRNREESGRRERKSETPAGRSAAELKARFSISNKRFRFSKLSPTIESKILFDSSHNVQEKRR